MADEHVQALEALLGSLGVNAPIGVAQRLISSLTADGQLQSEYAELDADDQRRRLVDLIDPRLDEMQAQLDQIINLLANIHDGSSRSRSGPSRFLRLLDRTPAWDALRLGCLQPGHRAFIVHGTSAQNVELFCARVRERADQLDIAHDVVEINHVLAGQRAELAEDWDRHFDHALGPAGLAGRASAQPLIVMPCDGARPLRTKYQAEPSGLGRRARAGLCEFLRERLPARLTSTSCKQPVRVLVPIEYRSHDKIIDDVLYLDVAASLRAASVFAFDDLLPLEFPNWADVHRSLREIHGAELRASVLDECRAAYDAEHSKPHPSFHALACALDDVLAHHAEAD